MFKKELRTLLLTATVGLALTLACLGWYLHLMSAGTEIEGRVLRLSISLSQQLLKADSTLRSYLATGNKAYLKDYRSAAPAIPKTIKDLEQSSGEMSGVDSMLASATKHLTNALNEWKKTYIEPTIKLKLAGDNRRVSTPGRKATGARHSTEVREALAFVQGHVEKTLAIYHHRMKSRKQLALAGVLGGLTVSLLAGAAFFHRRQASLEQWQARSERLKVLADYADKIHHMANADQAARMLLSSLTHQAAQALVLFRTNDGEGLRIAASEGGLQDGSDRSPILDDPNLCPVMRTGQRLVIGDVAREHPCDCPLGAPKAGGYACTPLLAQGRVVGLVNWKTGPGRPIRPADLDHADAIARVTSLALSSLFSLGDAKHEAVTDQLTGVFNRRFLDSFLEKQTQVAIRLKHPLAVLMLDLDQFKAFNDRHGHQAGDTLLKAFAQVATACVREGDLVARYGGEEFTVVLPNATREAANEIAERIRAEAETMRVPELAGMAPPVTTVSIGLAVVPDEAKQAAGLISAADAALYNAKQAGRNRVVVASKT